MSSLGYTGIINWVGGVDYALLEANLGWVTTLSQTETPYGVKVVPSPVMKWQKAPIRNDSDCGDRSEAWKLNARPPRLKLGQFMGKDDGDDDDDDDDDDEAEVGFIWMEWFWEDCISPGGLSYGFSPQLVKQMRNEKYPVLVMTQPLPPQLEFHDPTLTSFMRELDRADLLQGIGSPRQRKSGFDSWVVCLDSKVNGMILRKLKKSGKGAKGAALDFLKYTVGNAGLSEMERGGK